MHLAPQRHELLLFDINRFAAKAMLLIADPAPFTDRLMNNSRLPFALTLVTNMDAETREAVARRKVALEAEVSQSEPLDLAWPRGGISLSHVALPFPPDDPLYGQYPQKTRTPFFLGKIAIQGERDLLKIPPKWFLRQRYNPFYAYLETRVLEWIEGARDD